MYFASAEMCWGIPFRGALHSLETAYEIFSKQKDLYGFLMDFS